MTTRNSIKSTLLLLLGLIVSLASARPAHGQTVCSNPCTLTVGQTYSVAVDHDGQNTTGYRVYLDGVKQGNDLPLSVLANGSVTVSGLSAPARGSHTLQIAAFNEDGETKSDPLSFTVKKLPPGKPINPRILITVVIGADGAVTFKVNGVESSKQ